jgi:hypothetical protein
LVQKQGTIMHEDDINETVQLGLANRKIIELARNWCAHIEVEQTGGVGIVEHQTGLPIGSRAFVCKHATGTTIGGMDLRYVAIHFYDNNCVGCPHRSPVGFPNLTQIVSERDRAVEEQAKREQHESEIASAALAERHTARLETRDNAPPSTAGIIDLIAELDAEYTLDAHARLGKLAATVPEQFDANVQRLLFALVNAGREGRTQAALEALLRTNASRRDVASGALSALARHEAVELSGAIVAEHLDGTHVALIGPALPALFVLASPPRQPFAATPNPKSAALLKAYAVYPDACERALRTLFATDHELTRVVAAGGWEVLMPVDGDIGPRMAPDALHSLSMQDRRLGSGNGARRATAHALAEAMKHRPAEMDAILQDASARGIARDVLLDAYADVCAMDNVRRPATPSPNEAVRLAFSRLLQAILDPDHGLEELRTILSFLRGEAKDREDALVENAAALLGVIAILIERIDELKVATSPLVAIGPPDPLSALEKQNRLILLGAIIETLSSLLGLAVKTDLVSVLPLLKDVLDNTSPRNEHLRSYVVRMLTGAAHDRGALVELLPYVYSALADNSQSVRAAAVAAYGVIAKHGVDDLPPLLNEFVTGLLLDPYVVVHLAVVDVLKKVRLPEPYRATATTLLAHRVEAYARMPDKQSSTRACIEAFTTQAGRPVRADTADRLIAIARTMVPDEAVRTLLELASYVPNEETWIAVATECAADPTLSEFERIDILRVLMRKDAVLLAKHADHLQSAVLLRLSELPFPRTFGDDDFLEVLVERLMLAEAWSAARGMLVAAEQRFRGTTRTQGRQTVAAIQVAAIDVEDAKEPQQRLTLARAWRAGNSEKLDTGAAIEARFDGLLALDARNAALLSTAHDAVKASASSIQDVAIRGEYMTFARILEAIHHLVRWRDATRGAEIDAERFRRAAVVAGREIEKEQSRFVEAGICDRLTNIADVDEIDAVATAALSVRLPLPLSKDPYPYRPSTPPIGNLEMDKAGVTQALSVMFTRFEFEGRPVDDPQVIAPGTLHELTVDVSLSDWPEGADVVVIDPLSVVPRSSYDMPTFTLKRLSSPPYHWRETGRFLLHHPQSLVTGPLEFQYRASTVPASETTRICIEGQRSVRLFAHDPSMHPQTGYADIDRKLLAIRAEVRRARVPEADIALFMRVMTALGSIAGRALSSHLFAGDNWPEKRFQAEVGDRLRAGPYIGSDLEEHPDVAAGSTDLSYKRIRIELKVEGGKTVCVEDARLYWNQESQYVAGSDRRLGVICILDYSNKESAPGIPSNDIDLVSIVPATGGLPVLLGVVIIRGNLKRPSDYSK